MFSGARLFKCHIQLSTSYENLGRIFRKNEGMNYSKTALTIKNFKTKVIGTEFGPL